MSFKAGREFRVKTLGLALVAGLLSSTAVRAESDDADTGSGRLQGSLTTLVSHTNNYFYQPTNEQSVTAGLLRPEIKFQAETSKTSLDLTGRVEYGTSTAPGSKDDYFDRKFGLDLGWTPTYRNRFSFEGSLDHGHDPFGIARTEGSPVLNTDLDQWNHSQGGARYRYGAPSARVNAEVGVSARNVDYTTNRAATQFLDYKSTTVDYNLFYNYTPKTSLVLSFSRTGVDFNMPFDTDGSGGPSPGDIDTRGGKVYQARAGIRWLATAKTSGDIRAGYRQRTFDNVPGNLEGFDWQAGVQWSPTSPLLVELKTARSEEQSYRVDANVIDVESNALSIKRTVNSRSRVSLDFAQTKSRFFGSGRDDQTRSAGVGLEYAAMSSVFLVANLGYQTRDSTLAGLDYRRMDGFVGLRLGRLR